MSQEAEEVKPKINLNVQHEGQQMTVKVKANMAFRKIFDAAAKHFNKDPAALKFTYDGTRINAEDTPASLGMEDGDMIDAHLEQIGGSLCITHMSIFH